MPVGHRAPGRLRVPGAGLRAEHAGALVPDDSGDAGDPAPGLPFGGAPRGDARPGVLHPLRREHQPARSGRERMGSLRGGRGRGRARGVHRLPAQPARRRRRGNRVKNPLPAFHFTVLLLNVPNTGPGSGSDAGDVSAGVGTLGSAQAALRMSFSEVTGVASEMEVEEYREGGNNAAPLKFVRWGRFPNLVCRRGVTPTTDLWDW